MMLAPAPVRPSAVAAAAEAAARVHHHVLDMCAGAEGGHLGSSLSAADILATLYFAVLRVDPADPARPDRDVFILSKGHAAIALYATLAERGFFPVEELRGYAVPGGRMAAHPVRKVPGVEMPTGSLGHGLSLGVGFALAARLDGSPRRVFTLLGDGELQEGSCWEAAMSAATLGLGNLVAVVDRNGLQLGSATEQTCRLEPLADRWRAFGWEVRHVDGHDHAALCRALEPPSARPLAVLAATVKGHGLASAAGTVKSHYASLSPRSHARARRELGNALLRPRP